MPTEARKPYPSDLTDKQWEVIEVLIPPAKSGKQGGRRRSVNMREVVNALLYLSRSGCQWDMLPHDLPPKSTVYEYFAAWRDDGTWEHILAVLRGAYRQLHAASEEPTPSAANIGSQTVKTTELRGVLGYDGGKNIKGRKRHIVVDSLGLLLAVAVTSAAVDDAAAAPAVLQQRTQRQFPQLEVVWADGKYSHARLYAWKTRRRSLGWRWEIVRRLREAQGLVLLPKRWVAERTFAWLGRCRQLRKDYDRHVESSEAMMRRATIATLIRRLVPHQCYAPFRYHVAAQMGFRIASQSGPLPSRRGERGMVRLPPGSVESGDLSQVGLRGNSA